MKTVMLFFALVFGIAECEAGGKQAPNDVVLKSFLAQYPQTHVRKWMVRNDTDIAAFKALKTKQYAFYLSNGTWIKTESEINHIADLPRVVENSWHQCAFQTWYVEDVRKVETPDEKQYVIKVIRKYVPGGYPGPEPWTEPGRYPEEYDLYFSAAGSLLKKVQLN